METEKEWRQSRSYPAHGISMLQVSVHVPKLDDECAKRCEILFARTINYAETVLLPRIIGEYEGLSTLSAKMHFLPYRYVHKWEIKSLSSSLLAVRALTILSRGTQTIDQSAWDFCYNTAAHLWQKKPKKNLTLP